MANGSAAGAPIIVIKKVKKGGHGHHGGAWKVAYADFVTAMMAFFMLLWLLGSTTDSQKNAISDYFLNPSSMEGPGGASTSMIDMGGQAPEMPVGYSLSQSEDDADPLEQEAKVAQKVANQEQLEMLEAAMSELVAAVQKNQALAEFKDQLLMDITSEGLRIQIVDKDNRPMFDKGSLELKSYTRTLLAAIAEVIRELPNKIAISGHTDAAPFNGPGHYTNWELSADRANAARRALTEGGVPETQIARVVGMASSVPLDASDPLNAQNRRIAIVVMNASEGGAAALH